MRIANRISVCFRTTRTFLLVVGVCSCFDVGAQIEMPVGVPDPASYWGGNHDPVNDLPPPMPNVWTEELPGYYFVSNTNGSDNNRTFGTPGLPRKTIPRPVPAGSYVVIEGDYAFIQGGSQFIEAGGSSDVWSAGRSGPVWIVSSESVQGRFIGAKVILFGSYLNVSGLSFGAGGRVQVSSGATGYAADHIVVKDSVIEGIATTAKRQATYVQIGSEKDNLRTNSSPGSGGFLRCYRRGLRVHSRRLSIY